MPAAETPSRRPSPPARSTLLIEPEVAANSLLIDSGRKEPPQAGDAPCLLPDVVAQSRSIARDDPQDRFGDDFGAGRLLFVGADRLEGASPARVVVSDPIRRRLPVSHHGRLQKVRLHQG